MNPRIEAMRKTVVSLPKEFLAAISIFGVPEAQLKAARELDQGWARLSAIFCNHPQGSEAVRELKRSAAKARMSMLDARQMIFALMQALITQRLDRDLFRMMAEAAPWTVDALARVMCLPRGWKRVDIYRWAPLHVDEDFAVRLMFAMRDVIDEAWA